MRYIFATTVLAGLAVMLANVPPLSGAAESSPPKTAPAEGQGTGYGPGSVFHRPGRQAAGVGIPL